jgi:ABC-type multidrug transport system fused ATPase/permease subunit
LFVPLRMGERIFNMDKLNRKGIYANLNRSRNLLAPGDRKKYYLLTFIQAFLGIIDLLSVAVVGIIASIAVNGISNSSTGETANRLLKFLHLSEYSIQTQATILGVFVGILLVSKSLFSLYINKRILLFLGYRSAKISKELISKLVQQNVLVIEEKSAQQFIYSATTGINSIVIGVLGNFSALVGDLVLCVILSVGLFVYSPGTTLFTILILGMILFGLFLYVNKESIRLSSIQTNKGIVNAELLTELLENYREAIVRSRRGYYEESIAAARGELAYVTARQTWLPNVSKYILEVTVMVFTLFLAYLQFQSKDAVHAVGSLAIFLVAGARLAPSLLRIQQFMVAINAHSTSAGPTFNLFDNFSKTKVIVPQVSKFEFEHRDFVPEVIVHDLIFKYPNNENLTINMPRFKINKGDFVAIVGPSGAGKSTIIDLILGILEPQVGEVTISGVPTRIAFDRWPGAVAYVSQKVGFSTGTIKTCIAGGYDVNDISDEIVWDCLEKAHLAEFVNNLPLKLDEYVGEKATNLSGGQRQRLALARAMLTRPLFLVLDEATSALDSETESLVSRSILEMKGETTLLVVAHRLSTVRMADRIIYLEGGKVLCEGSFEEVRMAVPNFDVQAKLMGL